MMTNTNFIGSDSASITVIPVKYSETYTVIQALERDISESHPTQTTVVQIIIDPSDLFNLITALTMRYNDLPAKSRDNITVELRRVVSSESDDNLLRF